MSSHSNAGNALLAHITIRDSLPADIPAMIGILTDSWGSQMVGSHGVLRDASALPALIAETADAGVAGLLTYEIQKDELEVISLDALTKHAGIGTALLARIYEIAKLRGLRRVFLGTSNDNIDALRFYQRRGFRLCRVLRDAVTRLREVKPCIPLIGDYGIPLQDELELERIIQYDDQ